jgi:hypothetical protein
MSKFFLRFLTGFMVFVISSLVLAATDNSPNTELKSKMFTKQEKTNQNSWVLKYGNVPSLVFRGIPNETQTGEITYVVSGKLANKSILIKITGSAFDNGESSLVTEFQPGDAESWCKAGEAFIMQVAPGTINTIRYRATTGPTISSQNAGAYTVKLSFIVISYK